MNEIVKFEDERGQVVKFGSDDVRKFICESATDKEIAMFMAKCQTMRMNPFIGEAYLVKYGQGAASMIVGKEVFTKRANARKDYKGNRAGVTFLTKSGAVEKREGSAVYKAAGETLLGGWCAVYVEGKEPVYNEVTLEEYSTGRNLWASKPATMVRKVALVQSLREAFPDAFQGLYSEEEMGRAGEQVATLKPVEQPAPVAIEAESVEVQADEVEAVEVIQEPAEMTAEQSEQIAALVKEFAALRDKTPAQVFNALLATKTMREAGATLTAPLTTVQAVKSVTILTRWVERARFEQKCDDENALAAEMQAPVAGEC